MTATLRGRARLFGLVLVLGLGVGGGIAYATIPGMRGEIRACYDPTRAQKESGTPLNIVDGGSASCKKSDVELTWSQTGPRGPAGPAGADGASVTSAALAPGDANCPDGGSRFSAAGSDVTYACNGAKGEKGDPGPSAAYTNYGDGYHSIPGGGTQTVASVTLPPGSYVLSGAAYALDAGGTDFLQCNFVAPGATVHGLFAVLTSDGVEPMLGDVTLAVTTSVFLRCNAQNGMVQGAGQMIATRVGTVTPSL